MATHPMGTNVMSEELYETEEYTIAHAACYRISEDGSQWIMLVKTCDGKIDYSKFREADNPPVLKFYMGIAKDNSPEEQHRVVREGTPFESDSLTMFLEKADY
jgi:hypothetical protein